MTVRQVFQRLSARVLCGRRCASAANALAQAIENKDLEKLRELLSQGLKSIFNNDLAIPHPEGAFKNALEKLGEIDATTLRQRYPHLYKNQKTTPLTLDVIAGFGAGAELLIEKGAKIFEESTLSQTGYTGPLGGAIFRGDVAMIKLLMKHESVQQELENPAFRNYLLHTAVTADSAAALQAIADCDPQFLEKARAYGTQKAADFKLGEGVMKKAKSARQAARG